MKIRMLLGVAAMLSILPCYELMASDEVDSIRKALSEGKRCEATWGPESSKNGQKTEVFGVRTMDGKIQYQVSHSAEYPKIWTWDFRIINIKCHN